MPSSHSEICAYIQQADLDRLACALTGIALSEGRVPLAVPVARPVRYVLDDSDHWNVMLLPGAPGWTTVHAQPWNVLGKPGAEGSLRFVALCKASRSRGFLIDVVDEGSHGQMLTEAERSGAHRLSGWYVMADGTMQYNGVALDEDQLQTPVFEICADLSSARQYSGHGLDLSACMAIAHDVGGANGRLLWSSGEDFSGAWYEVQEAMAQGGPAPGAGGRLLQYAKHGAL